MDGKIVKPPRRHQATTSMTRSSSAGSNLSSARAGSGALAGCLPDHHPELGIRQTAKQGAEAFKRMIANKTYVEMSVIKATTPSPKTDGPPERKHTDRPSVLPRVLPWPPSA